MGMVWNRIALAALLLPITSFAAGAVTVDVDVVSKGEPVPGAEISFETADGSVVPPQPPASPTTKPESPSIAKPPGETPVVQEDSQVSTKAEPTESKTAESTPNVTKFELPDNLVGKKLTLVVKKDGEIVKRQPMLVQQTPSRIEVKAFDPADAEVSVALDQNKPCRLGHECDLGVSITNGGSGIYKGPVFLVGVLQGSLRRPIGSDDALACVASGGGQTLCRSIVSLEPGETLKWPIGLSLPSSLTRKSSNCIELLKPGTQAQEGRGSLIQAVQLALSLRGKSTVKVDGHSSLRTREAIAEFLGKASSEGVNFEQIYEKLYEHPSSEIAALGLGETRACQRLALSHEASQKPAKTAKSVKQKPAAKSTATTKQASTAKRQRATPVDTNNGGVGSVGGHFGVGIGGGEGGGKDKYRHKKRKLEGEPEFKD